MFLHSVLCNGKFCVMVNITNCANTERRLFMAISSISNQNLRRNYQSLSSGKRINKAADDAAALAIAQKLLSQKNGYDSGYRDRKSVV